MLEVPDPLLRNLPEMAIQRSGTSSSYDSAEVTCTAYRPCRMVALSVSRDSVITSPTPGE